MPYKIVWDDKFLARYFDFHPDPKYWDKELMERLKTNVEAYAERSFRQELYFRSNRHA